MGKANKIAVFADLHFTVESGRLKGDVLRWAVREASWRGCEAIVCAGDMIGSGRKAEAEAVAAILAESALPVSLTPGNAELRCPAESAEALAILTGAPPPEGVALVDSSRGWGNGALGDRALPAGTLVVTHVLPSCDSSGVLAPLLVVAGHTHRDSEAPGLSIVRGLDPDKALGGPPAFAIYGRAADGSWRREEDVAFPGVSPGEWNATFRRDFLDDLGLATMADPFGGLDFAITNGIRCLELRYRSWKQEDFGALRAKVGEWRAAGGRILSMHLSEPTFVPGLHGMLAPPETGGAPGGRALPLAAQGVEGLCGDCRDAVALGCDRVTLHVPKIPAADYDASIELMRDAYAEALAPLAGTGIAIGVENMHMTAADREPMSRFIGTCGGASRSSQRRFGYTPGECARQIALLREIPGLRVGFHLDIGHARNNAPFSTQFPIGAWYELLGAEVNGMHIHQVEQAPDGSFSNHRPLTGFFEPLIALSSLIMARQRGILPRAPMFLEVRNGLGPDSWLALANAASRTQALL